MHGHEKRPTPGHVEETAQKNIREEHLFKTNGPAYQLKPQQPSSVDEAVSYETSEEDDSPVPATSAPPAKPKCNGHQRLNYHDIGYEHFEPKDAHLVVVTRKPHKTTQKPTRPGHHNHHNHRSGKDCGCAKNLIVDLSQATADNQRRISNNPSIYPVYQFT